MIKNTKEWEKFERKLIASTKPNFKKNVKIFQMLYDYAVQMKAFPLKDPLEGIETDIRVAKILNGLK